MTDRYQPHTYPPESIKVSGNSINILHITDLHLCLEGKPIVDCHNIIDLQSCNMTGFHHILYSALEDSVDYDLILLTGDLTNKIDKRVYDYIFNVLSETEIPFVCIAGNHDVTDEIGDDLPFEQRQFIAYVKDERLVSQHAIEFENWQVILLDSSDPGKVSGYIEPDELRWLKTQLTNNSKHALICLHHNPVPIQSAWIDQHMLVNANELWQTIKPFKQVKSFLFGHVHQDFFSTKNGVQIYSTPATSYQFKPKQKFFCLDDKSAGYRQMQLDNQGNIHTKVIRVDFDILKNHEKKPKI